MDFKIKLGVLKHLVKIATLLCCLVCCTNVLAATFVLDVLDGANEGFNDNSPPFADQTNNPAATLGAQRLAVFQAAADFWGSRLSSDVIIRISVNMDPLPCAPSAATLGSTGAQTSFSDFPGAPRANTFYPVALANSIAGEDLTPGPGANNNDIRAVFNVSIDNNPNCLPSNWWLGIDSPPAPGTISFFNTVLHELGHGLGFSSLISTSTGAKPQGLDDTYSIHLFDEQSNQFWSEMTNAERLASATNTGNVVWRGENADSNSNHLTAASRTGGHIRMFAPNPLEPGASISHWDTTLSPDEVMEPILNLNQDVRSTLQLFRDIGWNIITGPVPSSPGEIGFITTSSSATENQGQARLLVARSGGSEGSASVRVRSQDISADSTGAEIDYTPVDQIVNWADGETGIRTINVFIVDDGIEEANETASFNLSEATGGATIGQDSNILTIVDSGTDDDLLLKIVPIVSAILRRFAEPEE